MTTTSADFERVSRRVGAMSLSLVSETEIVMTRQFDAPRALVFRAHSSCEHIRAWFGRHQDSMPSCEMDFLPAGKWRFVNRDEEGSEFVFFGEYLEIVEPERITWTFGFEGMSGDASVETLTFEEHDGRTTLRAHADYGSREARDAMIASGMENGAAETWDRLAEHLVTMS